MVSDFLYSRELRIAEQISGERSEFGLLLALIPVLKDLILMV